MIENGQKYTVEIAHYIAVPESHHPVPTSLEPSIAIFVGGRSIVLPSVSLDNQFRLKTNKVHNVIANGLLSFELVPGKSMRAKISPYDGFGIGGCRAHIARKSLQCHYVGTFTSRSTPVNSK